MILTATLEGTNEIYVSSVHKLEPDLYELQLFTDAIFRHAKGQYVSMRAFYEDGDRKAFRIIALPFCGAIAHLNRQAMEIFRTAANAERPVVVCPPLATFKTRDGAKESDIEEGLALTVECDAAASAARTELAKLLGEPTVTVISGGKWTNPKTGEVEDKLHLHWRLAVPARGKEALAKLRQARDLACRVVGADPSSKAVCHPIRWPGSWHKKQQPRLCWIESICAEDEIDLDKALAILQAASPQPSQPNGKDHSANSNRSWSSTEEQNVREWLAHWENETRDDWFKVGAALHSTDWPNAREIWDEWSETSSKFNTADQDKTWSSFDRPYEGQKVTIATLRMRATEKGWRETADPPADAELEIIRADTVKKKPIEWHWPDRFAIGKFGLVAGLPDEGKGLFLCDMTARTTRGMEWPCDEGVAPAGDVLILSGEDAPSDTIVPRLESAGADLTRVHIIGLVKTKDKNNAKKRMFNIVTDLPLLRTAIRKIGNVKLVFIDPISAHLGVGKVDSFRGTDVRGAIGPLGDLAEEEQVAIIGIMHFNKKADVTNVLLRISDSLAFAALARHVYAIIDDLENKRKLFVRGKNNLATKNLGALAFNIGAKEIDGIGYQPHILWHPHHIDISASEALQAVANNKTSSALNDAKQFLADLLCDGPLPQPEIKDAANGHEISWATVRRAKKDLRVKSTKDGAGGWKWALPTRSRPGIERE